MPRPSAWHGGRNRARIGQCRWRHGLDWIERALVNEEFVEHALDRCLGLIGTGIPHGIMLEAGLYDRNARLLTDFFRRNDTRIRLEHRILRTERQDLEFAVSHKRHAQIVERDEHADLNSRTFGV